MAYMNLTDLVQRCIIRLRQVAGVTTQAYAEQGIEILLEECYEQCRGLRWWDHLTSWNTYTLDETTGKITGTITGARERMGDVQVVFAGTQQVPLPLLNSKTNLARYTGTTPRAMAPLSIADDALGEKLFKVYPLASTGDIQVRLRQDPVDLFDDPAVVVPFDSTALVNGACFKYAIMDGTNPGSVQEFDRAYNERIEQLQKQHDTTIMPLDTRAGILTDWIEEPFR